MDYERLFQDDDFRALSRARQRSWLAEKDPKGFGSLGKKEQFRVLIRSVPAAQTEPSSTAGRVARSVVGTAGSAVAMPLVGGLEAFASGAEAVGLEGVAEGARTRAELLRAAAGQGAELAAEAGEELPTAGRVASEIGGGLLGAYPYVASMGPVTGFAALAGGSQYGAEPDKPVKAAKEAGKGAVGGAIWKRLEPASRLARGLGVGATIGGLELEHLPPEEAAKGGAVAGGLAAILGGGRVLPEIPRRARVEDPEPGFLTFRRDFRPPRDPRIPEPPPREPPPVPEEIPGGAVPVSELPPAPRMPRPAVEAPPALYPGRELAAAERAARMGAARERQQEPPPPAIPTYDYPPEMQARHRLLQERGERARVRQVLLGDMPDVPMLPTGPSGPPVGRPVPPPRQAPPILEMPSGPPIRLPAPQKAAKAASAAKAARIPPRGQRETTIEAPGGAPERATYELVEANDLVASHRAGSFQPNPAYPQGVQERAYHRVPEEQAKVIRNADQWDPRFVYSDTPTAIDGPPVVTPSGIVLGGNSRAMSAQRIAAGQAKTPKETLRAAAVENAQRFGLDPEAAAKMEAPIIVRRLAREPEQGKYGGAKLGGRESEAAELARRLNQGFTQEVGKVERGVSLSKSLSKESLETFASATERAGDDATIRATLRADRSFRDALERDGIITPESRNKYVNRQTGELTDDGLRLAEDVLLGRVIPDADVVEGMPASWRDKVLRGVPAIVRADLAAGEGVPPIARLVEGAARSEIRRRASGQTLDDFLAQRDLTGEAPSQADPAVAAVHRLLVEETPLGVKRRMVEYARKLEEATSGQQTLLGPPPSPESVFNEVIVGRPPDRPSEIQRRLDTADAQIAPGNRVQVQVGSYAKPRVAEGEILELLPDGRVKVRIPKAKGKGTYTHKVRPEQIHAVARERAGVDALDESGGFFGPGWNWQPFRDADLVAPDTPLPRKLIRRGDIMFRLSKALDLRFHEGGRRLRHTMGKLPKEVAGYWDRMTEALRIQRWGDIQVTAHEVFHALGDRFPQTFGQLARRQERGVPFGQIDRELHGLSYDVRNSNEGYAEAGRLWFTQKGKLEQLAPTVYAEIEAAVNAMPRTQRNAMRRAQRDMHDFFAQGAKATMEAKIGAERRLVEDALSGLPARVRNSLADSLHRIADLERRTTGTLSPDGAWEFTRRLRGVGELADQLWRTGAPRWETKPGGNVVFDGPGLYDRFAGRLGNREVPGVLDSKARLRSFLRYAIARQAKELHEQGRERLFTKREIEQGLTEAKGRPEYEAIFESLKEFQSKIADFAESSGLFSPEMRARWNREEYAFAFFREMGRRYSESTRGKVLGQESSPIHSLGGSSRNLREPLESLTEGPMRLIQLSFENIARRKIADLIDQYHGGLFGQRIPAENVPRLVSKAELERALQAEQRKLGLKGLVPRAKTPEWLEVLTLWESAKPHGDNIMTVLVNGKPRYYEVGDPMLVEALAAFRRAPAVPFFNTVRRFKQRWITRNPGFMFANAMRDLPMAVLSTKTGSLRFLANAARGYYDGLFRRGVYDEFIQNLGGQSTLRESGAQLQRWVLQRARAERFDPRAYIHPGNVLKVLDHIGRAIELGPRLAEYRGARQLGYSKGHAAFLGREITTDFGQFGARGRWMRLAQDTIPFFNAMTQSLDRVYRLAARDPEGKAAFAAKAAMVPLFSLALYNINRHIPEYADLPDHEKDLYWHYFFPKAWLPDDWVEGLESHEPAARRSPFVHLKQPKFWELGSIASIAERAMSRMLGDEPEVGEAVMKLVAANFGLDTAPGGIPVPLPVVVQEVIEQYANRDTWTGAPIVPAYVQDYTGDYSGYQIKSTQGPAWELFGQTTGVSPARAEAVFQSMFGSFVALGSDLADRAVAGGRRTAPHQDEGLVTRRFYSRPGKHSRVVDEYYDLYEEMRPALAAAQSAWKMGSQAGGRLLDQARPDVPRAAAFEGLNTLVSNYNAQIRLLRRGLPESLTPAQRRDMIEDLEQRKRGVMRQAVEALGSRGSVRRAAGME